MDCNFCKKSRKLFYSDKVDIRLPFEKKERKVEIIEKVSTHVFCRAQCCVVPSRCDGTYCEYERSVFDSFEEQYSPKEI